MQRQTTGHNRWIWMSATTMVVLLGCSVGCVSFEHHFRRHSVVAHLAENQAGRYYHCPHCGQIIPREGFSKCPRCLQVPAYHGYEPTCWRQWPQGWGCPPEPVADNPEFWEQGMLDSDAVEEELTMQEDPTQSHQLQPPMEEPVRHLPDAEPGRSEVVPSPLPHDVASVQEEPLTDSESVSDGASEPAGEIASADLTRSTDVIGSTEQSLAVDPSDLGQLDVESSVLPDNPIARDDQPVETPDTDAPCFNDDQATDVAQVEPSAITPDSIPDPAQLCMPIEPAEVAIDTATPVPSETTAVANQPEPEMVTSVPPASPFATDIQKDEDAVSESRAVDAVEPEFEIASRIPVPTSESMLTSEDVNVEGEGAGDLNDPPSLVHCPPKVIAVEDQDVVAQSEASFKVTQSEASFKVTQSEASFKVARETAPKVTPHDKLEPLPVGKAQLAETKNEPSTSSVTTSAEPVVEGTYPVPVRRIALPTPVPARVPGEYYPTPVRRIQLSELPIRVHR